MLTFKNSYQLTSPAYPLESIAPLEKLLLMDIETTGFTAGATHLYLIGCCYYEGGKWHIIQWFAEHYEEEEELLRSFFEFSRNYTHLIHYNGNNFDIPYLQNKCTQHHLFYDFGHLTGVDLYRRISPYKKLLKLDSLKQKSIERFLHLPRNDKYDGGQLIGIYHDYVKNPLKEACELLVLHNYEDLKGMLDILPVLAYVDVFNQPLHVTHARRLEYTNSAGKPVPALIIDAVLPVAVPVPVSYGVQDCFLTIRDDELSIKISMLRGELKFFYPDYQNYYYLPEEDMAMHKSVAAYVDKNHRQQATARNCYLRKSGLFLPQWEPVFAPAFQAEYGDKLTFFELTDDMKRNVNIFNIYGEHLLQTLLKEK